MLTLSILLGVMSAIVMMYASRTAIRHAIASAESLRLPPFFVGMTLVALGTDAPELVNSIVCAYMGHGDLAAGDAIGSVYTQGSLILGLFPFFAGAALIISRRETLPLISMTVLALGLCAGLVQDGGISQFDAIILILSWVGATWMSWRIGGSEQHIATPFGDSGGVVKHLTLTLAALIITGLAAMVLVKSIVTVSQSLGVPEYILAFFLASIGTSLPELVVELTALRKGKKQIAIGDVLGSCLIDSSLAVGIGPLIFPTEVTPHLAVQGIVIAAGVMGLAGLLFLLRKTHDKVSGIFLLISYATAYAYLLK